MLCIIKYKKPQFLSSSDIIDIESFGSYIAGFIIATDMTDARRQATAAWDQALASELCRLELEPAPAPGKYIIPPVYLMLVYG